MINHLLLNADEMIFYVKWDLVLDARQKKRNNKVL